MNYPIGHVKRGKYYLFSNDAMIKFYESGDNTDLKQWIYETSIDGIDLNNQ